MNWCWLLGHDLSEIFRTQESITYRCRRGDALVTIDDATGPGIWDRLVAVVERFMECLP